MTPSIESKINATGKIVLSTIIKVVVLLWSVPVYEPLPKYLTCHDYPSHVVHIITKEKLISFNEA